MVASMHSDGSTRKIVDSLSTVNTVIEEMITNVDSVFTKEDRALWMSCVQSTDALTYDLDG
jgi:hypothetical protein